MAETFGQPFPDKGRIARGIKLAPAYADLAIPRWRMLYPDHPVTLESDGRDYDAVSQGSSLMAQPG